jgi:hypothetical protein
MKAASKLLLLTAVCSFSYVLYAQNPYGDRELLKQVAADYNRLAVLATQALTAEPTTNDNYRDPVEVRGYPQFFVDSYAVRALAVAADLTGNDGYFDACRIWADRMIEYQRGMTPSGAYYMNYHRKPGQTSGQWFVADCGSIAMGVLAVAMRYRSPKLRAKYLQSVEEFVNLVRVNYVLPSGGITDGVWDKSDDEWWCSTCLVTAAAFQLYGVTGKPGYLETAMNGIDWLLEFEYDDTILYDFEDGAPTTVFYVMEAYVSALPFLKEGSERRRKVVDKISASVEWMTDTQERSGTWDYNPDNWGVKLGGLPCHMLIYLGVAGQDPKTGTSRISDSGNSVPLRSLIGNAATSALMYFSGNPGDSRKFSQQDAFTMMSYAELLCPGELYAKTGPEFPYQGRFPFGNN